MSYLQVKEDQTVSSDGMQYLLSFTVLAAQGISPSIFVLRTSDDGFDHVASVYDMNHWPEGRVAAVGTVPAIDFYRVPAVTFMLPSKLEASKAATLIQGRILWLNITWQQAASTSFGGSQILTYDSGRA